MRVVTERVDTRQEVSLPGTESADSHFLYLTCGETICLLEVAVWHRKLFRFGDVALKAAGPPVLSKSSRPTVETLSHVLVTAVTPGGHVSQSVVNGDTLGCQWQHHRRYLSNHQGPTICSLLFVC